MVNCDAPCQNGSQGNVTLLCGVNTLLLSVQEAKGQLQGIKIHGTAACARHEILAQRRFDDAVPEILVTLFSFVAPGRLPPNIPPP